MAHAADIGRRLRDRRREVGLSQRELSAPGVSYAYISRIEAGKRTPSTKALRSIAPRLGVSAHWLETGEPDPGELLAEAVRILREQGVVGILEWSLAVRKARENLRPPLNHRWKRAIDLAVGDLVDLEGDKYADPDYASSLAFYRLATVEAVEVETSDCVLVHFEEHGSFGFPRDHVLPLGIPAAAAGNGGPTTNGTEGGP